MWARTCYSARATILAHLGTTPSQRSRLDKLLPEAIDGRRSHRGPQSPAESLSARRQLDA